MYANSHVYISTLWLVIILSVTHIVIPARMTALGTCEASRFDSNSNRMISIRFESDGLIRNFRISRTCHRITNHAHCSTKKTSNRCAVITEIYFMFMILCLCSNAACNRLVPGGADCHRSRVMCRPHITRLLWQSALNT